jgi:hypothetical protein
MGVEAAERRMVEEEAAAEAAVLHPCIDAQARTSSAMSLGRVSPIPGATL